MENYIAAKERIFENQLSTDFMVLNIDDPIVADINIVYLAISLKLVNIKWFQMVLTMIKDNVM